jgi:hypothetical protein
MLIHVIFCIQMILYRYFVYSFGLSESLGDTAVGGTPHHRCRMCYCRQAAIYLYIHIGVSSIISYKRG